MNRTFLITGANAGLGKEAARQLALQKGSETIYLACRSMEKALRAKAELEASTGKKIFEIVILDTSNLSSVKQAVSNLAEPIDALIMNAGGMGGKTPQDLTKDGVNQIFASNVLGHVVLVDELLKSNKLNNVAMYASSEAARGIAEMNIPQPKMRAYSVEEFQSIFNGSYFEKWDLMTAYAHVKLVATLWMSAMARKHPNIRFVSVSPGSTSGTEAMDDMPATMRFMFKYVMMPIVMPLRGMVHKLHDGAKRYVDVVQNSNYSSGKFYASSAGKVVGRLVDQSALFPDLKNQDYQDRADQAIHQLI